MIEKGGGPQHGHRLSPKAQALVDRVNATNHALGIVGDPLAFLKRLTALGATKLPTDHSVSPRLHFDGQTWAQLQARLREAPRLPHVDARENIHRDPLLEQRGMLGYGLAQKIVSGALAPLAGPEAAALNGPHAQQAGFAPIGGLGLAGKAISEIANAALATPAGVVATALHPERAGKQMGHAVVGDVQHPLRRPGYTGLDLFALLSAGVGASSRLAAGAGELGGEGALASRAGRAAVAVARKPAPVERSLAYKPPGSGGLTARPLGSENALTGLIQKAHDKVLQAALNDPHSPLHSMALRRFGKELGEQDRQHDMIAATPAMRAKAAGAHLKPEEQLLLTSYHEGVHPADLATKHWEWAAGSKDALIRQQNERQAVIADKAAALIGEHGPEWAKLPPGQALPIRLQHAYRLGNEAGVAREQILRDAGKPVSGERVHGPARVVAGAEYVKPTPGKLGVESQTLVKARAYRDRLANLHERTLTRNGMSSATTERLGGALSVAAERVQKLEQAAAKRVEPTGIIGGNNATGRGYVPHTPQARPVRRLVSLAGRKSVGIPKEPGSLTHEFTGNLLKSGARRTDFTNLMGDAHLEAQRYFGSTLRLRDRAEKAAQATPDGIPAQHAIPVRLDKLKNHPFPNLVKQATGEHQAPLAPDELANLQHERNNFLREVFPLAGRKSVDDLSPAERATFERLRAEGKVGWVDKRLLGKAADTQHVPGKILQGVATGNNAIKSLMIYANPGHVLTRNASNLGMTVMRQGVLAPVNLARAARLSRTLGRDDLARLDSAVQSGSYSHVLNADDGLGKTATNFAAHTMHKLADARYRRAAFLHQAAKHGFRSTAQVSRLLNDKALADKLVEVSRRANDDIVDYGRLGPTEKAAVRHWVFVYPWVKGSTRFAAQTIAHHPVQAAAVAQVGREGQKFSQRSLGDVPSYLDGAFGVGGKMVVPEVANPIGTAAHVAQTAVGLLNGHGTSADMLGSFAPPLAQLGATLAFQRTGLGKSTLGQSLPRIVADSLEQELPAVAFGKRFTGGQNPNKLFSYSPDEAVGRLLGGAPFPRTYNPTILHQQAEKEKLALMAPDERVRYRVGEAVKQLPAQWAALQKKHPDIAKQVGADFVKQVEAAYRRDQDRQLALLDAAKAKGVSPGHLSALDRLNVTLTVAQSYGLTADDTKQILDAEKQLQAAKLPDKFRDRRYSAIASHIWKAFGLSAYKSAWQNRIVPYTVG